MDKCTYFNSRGPETPFSTQFRTNNNPLNCTNSTFTRDPSHPRQVPLYSTYRLALSLSAQSVITRAKSNSSNKAKQRKPLEASSLADLAQTWAQAQVPAYPGVSHTNRLLAGGQPLRPIFSMICPCGVQSLFHWDTKKINPYFFFHPGQYLVSSHNAKYKPSFQR